MATYTLKTDTPDGDVDNPAQADDEIRLAKQAMIERMQADHVMVTSASNTYDDDDNGMHEQVTFKADNTPVAVAAGYGVAHAAADPDSSNLELAYTDEDENTLQITKDGKFNLLPANIPDDVINQDAILLENDSYLVGHNADEDTEIPLIKVGLNEDSDDVAVLPDGAQTVTNAAPTLDKDLVNKKYVDDKTAMGNFTDLDSLSNTISVANTYTPDGDGFIHCIGDSSGGGWMYIDGVVMIAFNGAAGTKAICCPLSAGETVSWGGSIPGAAVRWKGINGSQLVRD